MTVLYFAWVKEKVGMSEESVSPPPEVATVEGLMDWLATRSRRHAEALGDKKLVKAAVDQVHAPLATSLKGAREVAFFPPVTGGRG
jgi:molybdopterin synthase sulfur carrier subunit